MKKRLFLLCGVLTISACFYRTMYHFDNKDLVWLSPYEQGDTILFLSAEGMDTMVVREKQIYDSHCPFAFNEVTDIMNANGVFESIILHDGDSLPCEMLIAKMDENVLSVYLKFEHRLANWEETNPNLQKVVCGDITYDDVVIIDSVNSDLNIIKTPSYNCESFIWSKSTGLIQYKYIDGETYTFCKKLPHKK